MNADPQFLRCFYKWIAIWGALGILPSFLVSGRPGIQGYLLGLFAISFIIGGWDFTLRFTLRARKTSTAMESIFVFLRYGLLGGLFYAIIRWFAVSPPWLFAGIGMIVPGMLTATFVYKEEEGVQDAED